MTDLQDKKRKMYDAFEKLELLLSNKQQRPNQDLIKKETEILNEEIMIRDRKIDSLNKKNQEALLEINKLIMEVKKYTGQ